MLQKLLSTEVCQVTESQEPRLVAQLHKIFEAPGQFHCVGEMRAVYSQVREDVHISEPVTFQNQS